MIPSLGYELLSFKSYYLLFLRVAPINRIENLYGWGHEMSLYSKVNCHLLIVMLKFGFSCCNLQNPIVVRTSDLSSNPHSSRETVTINLILQPSYLKDLQFLKDIWSAINIWLLQLSRQFLPIDHFGICKVWRYPKAPGSDSLICRLSGWHKNFPWLRINNGRFLSYSLHWWQEINFTGSDMQYTIPCIETVGVVSWPFLFNFYELLKLPWQLKQLLSFTPFSLKG